MRFLKKYGFVFGVLLALGACNQEAERGIEGGIENPEAKLLPPDPSFSSTATREQCIAAMNAAIAKSRCWVRGVAGNDNYSEVWFAPDSSNSSSGVLGYMPAGRDETEVDYDIATCDTNEIKMPQNRGITVKVSGDQMDFAFDEWGQPFRYTSSNDCVLSPE